MLVGGLVACVVSDRLVSERMLECGDATGDLVGTLDS